MRIYGKWLCTDVALKVLLSHWPSISNKASIPRLNFMTVLISARNIDSNWTIIITSYLSRFEVM